jgi:hypothetical protein
LFRISLLKHEKWTFLWVPWISSGISGSILFKITNIDPIKYDLLLSVSWIDRVSMPDIDIDFDDEGRGRVMDYVIKSMVQIRWLKLSLMVRWRPNRQFEIPLVYWIYLFWGRQNCQIDSGDDAI